MCDKSPYHQLILTQLNLALEKEEISPTEKTQLVEAKKVYEQNCSTCKNASNDSECVSMALEELLRMMPGKDKWKIYPWKNYEWDYGNFIDNNFSAKATGSSDRGLLKNLMIFFRLFDAYVIDPNPGTASIPGGRYMGDRDSDYPVYCVNNNNRQRMKARFDVGNNSPSNSSPPYDDPFFKNKPLAGVHSSSYFVRVGSCPRDDITDRDECAKKNFEWKSNNCFQPRYAYMNNEPLPIRKIQGTIPSIVYSGLALTPGKVGNAFSGKSNSRMIVQDCPNVAKKTTEGFTELYDPDRPKSHIQFGINESFIVLFSIFIGYFFYETFFKTRRG